jgi:hypothetical protein
MLRPELLRDHLEALRRVSRVSKEPAIAQRLELLADELRIIISVAAVADLASEQGAPTRKAPPPAGPVPEPSAIASAIERPAFSRRRRRKARAAQGGPFVPPQA